MLPASPSKSAAVARRYQKRSSPVSRPVPPPAQSPLPTFPPPAPQNISPARPAQTHPARNAPHPIASPHSPPSPPSNKEDTYPLNACSRTATRSLNHTPPPDG